MCKLPADSVGLVCTCPSPKRVILSEMMCKTDSLAASQPTNFTSHSDMPGKNSSSKVRKVSLIRKGITPR